MGPDGIHTRVTKELQKELAKPLSNIYQQSWLTGGIPDDWNLTNVAALYKNVCKEDPGKCKPFHGSRQGYGRDHPEFHCTAHAEQPGHQAQPK